MTKEEQQKLVSERDHIVIHRVTDNVIVMHNDGTEVYAVEIVRQPLVRCKECKFSEVWESTAGNELYCEKQRVCPYDWGTLTAFYVKPDDYCSYGEREGE